MDRRSNPTPAYRTTMRAEVLESREVPSATTLPKVTDTVPLLMQADERYAVAASQDGVSQVNVYNAKTNALLGIINPFQSKANGNISVATGDVTGDGVEDIIVGSGAGASPVVKIYDGKTLTEVGSFTPFSSSFHGGVTVAVGDVDGDGRKDIITGAGKGSIAQVKVFSGAALLDGDGKIAVQPIRNFVAFDNSYRGGVSVAAGDTDGDGRADIIVGKNSGNDMDVAVFSGRTGATLAAFSSYDASFVGGVTVAAGDTNGDGKAEVIVGANTAPANNVKVFRGTQMVAQYSANTGWGTRVAATDIDSDGIVELVAVSGPAAPPRVNILSAATGAIRRSLPSMPASFKGGLSIG